MKRLRVQRLQEEIQHRVSSILLFEVADPGLKDMTVTRVVLTPDLGQARVYYQGGQPPHDQNDRIQKALARACPFVRRQLASSLHLKSVPELQFFYDETSDEISKVENLFSRL